MSFEEAPGVKSKTCIVGVGCATRSARSAGILWELGTSIKAKRPDLVVGVSGASGNVVYYSTEQHDMLPNTWMEEIPRKEFFSLGRKPPMNLDFLIDYVLGKLYPLNTAKLGEYSIATHVVSEKKTRYGTEKDGLDPRKIMRASKAMPGVSAGSIELPWGTCNDGHIGCTVQDHVNHALSRKATHIVVIDDSQPTCNEKQWQVQVPEGVSLLHIKPRKLPIRRFVSNSKQEMQAVFDIGVDEARSYKDRLLEILGESSKREQGVTTFALPQELPVQAGGAGSTSAGS